MNRESRSTHCIVFLISFFLFFQLSVGGVYAEDMSVTPTPVDYHLPYPGLLPDHPFYFVRQIRDMVLNFVMSHPLKKAEFKLEQADKDVAAAIMLVEKKKHIDLAATSFSQAVVAFEEAIDATVDAKKQGSSITDFVSRLVVANLKHQEIAKQLEKQSPQKFGGERKKLEELGKRVKALQKQK